MTVVFIFLNPCWPGNYSEMVNTANFRLKAITWWVSIMKFDKAYKLKCKHWWRMVCLRRKQEIAPLINKLNSVGGMGESRPEV